MFLLWRQATLFLSILPSSPVQAFLTNWNNAGMAAVGEAAMGDTFHASAPANAENGEARSYAVTHQRRRYDPISKVRAAPGLLSSWRG